MLDSRVSAIGNFWSKSHICLNSAIAVKERTLFILFAERLFWQMTVLCVAVIMLTCYQTCWQKRRPEIGQFILLMLRMALCLKSFWNAIHFPFHILAPSLTCLRTMQQVLLWLLSCIASYALWIYTYCALTVLIWFSHLLKKYENNWMKHVLITKWILLNVDESQKYHITTTTTT